MSQIPGTGQGGPDGGPEQAPNPAMMVRRGRASVTLRGDSDVSGSLMDPANQSLADALKITYRLVQLAMIGLVVMFALSGFQSIQTGEQGIRLTFGAVENDDLQPGFVFSLPRPMGEILKIKKGVESMRLDEQFMPKLRAEDKNKSLMELANMGKQSLDPTDDGSLLTGDINIAHTRWSVQYQRENIRENAKNINPDFERRMVEAAVMRGIVHAAAGITIDELMKNQPDPDRKGPFPAIGQTARDEAQKALNAMNSGIIITQLSVEPPIPPLRLIADFGKVLTSQSQAQSLVQQAESSRTETLAGVAGDAAPVLLKQIDRYDDALATGKAQEAEAILSTIDSMLEGRPTEIDGQKVTTRVTGRVSGLLSEAQQYRSSAVSRSQADATIYEAKLAAFRTNPSVLLTGDWSEAFQTFLDRDSVQLFLLPPGARVVDLQLNRDPDIQREQERILTQQQSAEVERQRINQLQNSKFNEHKNTTTGVKE